ncbi:hypothetical protein KCU73_g8863, partial [Aureobasidium melanogenum]
MGGIIFDKDEDEDEGGGFFGSGTNQHTNAALDFVDRADDGADIKAEKIDQAWVRRLGLRFERKINKNSELVLSEKTREQRRSSSIRKMCSIHV